MVFYIVIGLAMAVSFIGMIVCAKKQADIPVAKPMSFLLLVVVLGCAIVILFKSMGSGEVKQIIKNEMVYANASAQILGSHLAKNFPGSNALIIVADKDTTSEHQKHRLEGLKAGMGSAINIVAIEAPDLSPPKPEGMEEEPPPPMAPDPEMPPEELMMPVEEMMRAVHFDALLDKYANCNLIISFIGLPSDLAEMKVWEMDPDLRPKIALLQGDVHALKNAFLGGAIVAAVAYRPDAKYDDQAPPKEPQAVFDKRYILITPESIEEIQAKYNMFE